MSINATLIADFKAEAALTRKVLEAVPEDRYDWKPHDKSMSLGQLASHLAENPSWVEGCVVDVFDMAAMEDYKPFAAGSREELLKTQEDNNKTFETVVSGMSDESLAATYTMKSGDQVIMEAPRQDVVRMIGIHHAIHHRGQLTVYLRLLDVPLPGTYGPSADEQPPA